MSLNDPQWGKRGRTGPPDLDEIWRNVNRRVNEMFGRKEAEAGEGGPEPRARLPVGGAGLLAALIFLVWLVSGFYIVDEGRRGVVTRVGRYTETTTPGPRWHLPFPIEAVEVVDFSQVKTVEIGYRNSNPKNKVAKESLMLTNDENIIDIQFAVQYSLKDAKDFLFNARKPEDIVPQVDATAISEVVGRSQVDFALYEGRAQIAAETEKLMQSILGSASKVLIDQKGGNSLLYLPLDQLLKQSPPGTPAADGRAIAPTPEATVTLDPASSRDALRGRERSGESR